MLGPEASLYAKLRANWRVLELLEATANVAIPREESSPLKSSQPSPTGVFNTSDRRTLPCTEQNCDDTTSTVIIITIQRLLFFICILVFPSTYYSFEYLIFLSKSKSYIRNVTVCKDFALVLSWPKLWDATWFIYRKFLAETVKQFPSGDLKSCKLIWLWPTSYVFRVMLFERKLICVGLIMACRKVPRAEKELVALNSSNIVKIWLYTDTDTVIPLLKMLIFLTKSKKE